MKDTKILMDLFPSDYPGSPQQIAEDEMDYAMYGPVWSNYGGWVA